MGRQRTFEMNGSRHWPLCGLARFHPGTYRQPRASLGVQRSFGKSGLDWLLSAAAAIQLLKPTDSSQCQAGTGLAPANGSRWPRV